MYCKNDISDLRILTGNVLDLAEKIIYNLMDENICRRDFDEISISLASKLNYIGSIYEELADRVGTMKHDERGIALPGLVSPAMKDFIVR